jgi:hypothetical protein
MAQQGRNMWEILRIKLYIFFGALFGVLFRKCLASFTSGWRLNNWVLRLENSFLYP